MHKFNKRIRPSDNGIQLNVRVSYITKIYIFVIRIYYQEQICLKTL